MRIEARTAKAERGVLKAERLLAAAMRQGDRLADLWAKYAVAADCYWRSMKAAVILIDRGNVDAARRVLEKALEREGRRGARR